MNYSIKDIVFIVNPHAGTTKSTDLVEKIRSADSQACIFMSESLALFDAFMKSEIKQYKIIVICGGDGTINNTLSYLLELPQLILAVLPNGSGDGFAREMGYTKDIDQLLKQIKLGKTKEIDLWKINEHYSCNMAGLGLDANVAKLFDTGNQRGLFAYIKETVKEVFSYKSIPVKATLFPSGEIIEGNYYMVNLANTRQFGNNAIIAPLADPTDAWLDLVLVKKIPLYKQLYYAYLLFNGKLKEGKYFTYKKVQGVEITTKTHCFHVDGEPKDLKGDTLSISLQGKLKVVAY